MSYILDALRKSDQQRQRGVPPTLLAPQAASAESRPRVPTSYLVVTAVLVGAGIVVGSLRPWQSESATTPPARNPLESTPGASPATAQPRDAQQPRQETSIRGAKAPIPSSAVLSEDTATGRQAPAVLPPQPKRQTPSPPRKAVPTGPQQTVKAFSAKPQSATPAPTAPTQKLVAMADLPLAVRQEIPAMSISVHAYSPEPRNRLVGINDRVLHEGEDVAPGLRLEEITRDGMILRYKGYRFLRGVR